MIYAYGHGLTDCGFCARLVRYKIDGRRVTVHGRNGWYDDEGRMPLFCSDECAAASALRLDEHVNQAAAQ